MASAYRSKSPLAREHNGVYLHATVKTDVADREPFWTYEQRLELPEEFRMALKDLVGDAQAEITIGIEVKSVENYQTCAAQAFVTLSCDQDEKTVHKAAEAAKTMAAQFCQEALTKANYILNKANGKDVEEPTPKLLAPKPAAAKEVVSTPSKPSFPIRIKPQLKRT